MHLRSELYLHVISNHFMRFLSLRKTSRTFKIHIYIFSNHVFFIYRSLKEVHFSAHLSLTLWRLTQGENFCPVVYICCASTWKCWTDNEISRALLSCFCWIHFRLLGYRKTLNVDEAHLPNHSTTCSRFQCSDAEALASLYICVCTGQRK